jgi:hypothetical protein
MHHHQEEHHKNDWRDVFHSVRDFRKAPPITFAIEGILQNDGATFIGGLSGHGKTFVMLSMVKALLSRKSDKKLWGHFRVTETAKRVLYLTPESTISTFKHRLKLCRLYDYVKDGRLLVHTLSKGSTPDLSDPRVLAPAKGAHVFLDTAVRFGEGDENDARDNQNGLATGIFGLLRAGARAVVAAHHSPKSFAKENMMRLENVFRGSGDIGAMLAAAWGIKQLDIQRNILHIENVKSRDFEACGPFQLIGRPYINDSGTFRLHKKPGNCGTLSEQPGMNRGGACEKDRAEHAEKLDMLRGFLRTHPKSSSNELRKRFAEKGITVKAGTIRKYRFELRHSTSL